VTLGQLGPASCPRGAGPLRLTGEADRGRLRSPTPVALPEQLLRGRRPGAATRGHAPTGIHPRNRRPSATARPGRSPRWRARSPSARWAGSGSPWPSTTADSTGSHAPKGREATGSGPWSGMNDAERRRSAGPPG